VMCLLLFSDVVKSAASAASTDICIVICIKFWAD
jgi:hypothetical protein